MLLVYLALGGLLGTLARYGLGLWVYSWAGSWLPWGTLAANLLGSLLLGFAIHATEAMAISPEIRGLITVGFCGAFTTFSALSYETVALLQEGEWWRASLYAFGSLGLGLAAVAGGLSLAEFALRT